MQIKYSDSVLNRKSCALTGHRPQKFPWKQDENDPRCVKLKEALNAQIIWQAQEGVTDFLSGMTEGVDTWAAQAVLDLRINNPMIRLHCILPCKGQADKWKASSREQYRSILEQADSIVYVHRDYSKGCMLERDRFLVAHAGRLLAVYNGERRGGTAATIHYARKASREIWILDPATRIVTYEKPIFLTLA